MYKRKALGNGLDALLGSDLELSIAEQTLGLEGVQNIPIESIYPNPDQPRQYFDSETLLELAESIKQQGVIQPVLVERKSDGRYVLIAGERRWRASQMANLIEVPAIVRTFTPEQKIEISLVENIQRENLTPVEEAKAYHKLMEILSLSQQELADKVGKNRSTVANSLRLLKLPVNIMNALDQGALSAGHARAILAVDSEQQQHLFNRIIKESLTVREAEQAVVRLNQGAAEPAAEQKMQPAGTAPSLSATTNKDVELNRLEEQFIEKLGTKVSLKGSLNKGRIEISWYNQEDLDRLYQQIIGE